MQPFPGTISYLKIRRQALRILNNFLIYVRDAKLQTVSHGELVGVHEEFVGKRGPNFEELKSAQLVGIRHEIGHGFPAVQYRIAGVRLEQAVLEKAVHLVSG